MRIGVLGIGKTPHKIQHNKSLRDLAVESGRAAMADAGVDPSDIQALYVGNVGSVGFNYENSTGLMVAHHLGVVPAGSVRVEAACGTGAWALHLGCVAILSGLYDTVMVLGAEKMNDLATVEGTSIIAQAADSKEEYFSGLTFPSGVALTARKYMQTYELSEEDLAHTSVKNHHYGARNPYAHLRIPGITRELVESTPMLWEPIRYLETCPSSDGACAIVLAAEHKATGTPAWVHGTAMRSEPMVRAGRDTVSPQAGKDCAADVYRQAGIADPRRDIDVAEVYVPFSWYEPMWLENLGFAAEGEGWKLTESGATTLGGSLPINPSGGVMCSNPIGASGMLRFAEAALQVRGMAGEHQVDGARLAMGHAYGGGSQFYAMWIVGGDKP